jgi:hypothetical protein
VEGPSAEFYTPLYAILCPALLWNSYLGSEGGIAVEGLFTCLTFCPAERGAPDWESGGTVKLETGK